MYCQGEKKLEKCYMWKENDTRKKSGFTKGIKKIRNDSYEERISALKEFQKSHFFKQWIRLHRTYIVPTM